jgi:hypothetical protein
MYADFDAEMGRRTRMRLIERCADTSTLLLSAHFPAPTAGHVCACGDAFRFKFLSD